MAIDSKTPKKAADVLVHGILGSRVWEMLFPHVPAGGVKIDPGKMQAIFDKLPKQELEAIAARASQSNDPVAATILGAIKNTKSGSSARGAKSIR